MTKQEEIREGIERMLREAIKDGHSPELRSYEILSYLHSQGVVIKVERELPKNPYTNVIPYEEPSDENLAYLQCQKDMEGYVAAEPLI